jgi:hypothetical protein
MKADEARKTTEDAFGELAAALEAGRSEKLTAFLAAMARFHRYSFGNVLLIATQRPDATHVAGFNAWRKLGRHVKRGERGLAIIAPIVHRKEEPTEDGRARARSREEVLRRPTFNTGRRAILLSVTDFRPVLSGKRPIGTAFGKARIGGGGGNRTSRPTSARLYTTVTCKTGPPALCSGYARRPEVAADYLGELGQPLATCSGVGPRRFRGTSCSPPALTL